MHNQTEKVFVIILNWNSGKDTIECIQSLAASIFKDFQIVLLDNASTDDSVKLIRNHFDANSGASENNNAFAALATFTDKEEESIQEALSQPRNETNHFPYSPILVQNSRNLGFARAHNIVMTLIHALGNYGYVWVLNNDTVIFPDTLIELVKEATRNQSTGLVGSILRYHDRSDIIQAVGGGKFHPFFGTSRLFAKNTRLDEIMPLLSTSDIGKLDYIMGASLLIKKDVISTVGVFSEDYFVYTEDLDYCYRAQQKGWKLSVALKSHLLHKESNSTKDKKELYYYLLARNNVTFIRKYFPPLTLISAIILLPFSLLRWTRKPKFLFYGLKGIMQGLLDTPIRP